MSGRSRESCSERSAACARASACARANPAICGGAESASGRGRSMKPQTALIAPPVPMGPPRRRFGGSGAGEPSCAVLVRRRVVLTRDGRDEDDVRLAGDRAMPFSAVPCGRRDCTRPRGAEGSSREYSVSIRTQVEADPSMSGVVTAVELVNEPVCCGDGGVCATISAFCPAHLRSAQRSVGTGARTLDIRSHIQHSTHASTLACSLAHKLTRTYARTQSRARTC